MKNEIIKTKIIKIPVYEYPTSLAGDIIPLQEGMFIEPSILPKITSFKNVMVEDRQKGK